MSPPVTATWSWKRAAWHAAIPVGLVVLVGALIAGGGAVLDPYRFGEELGRFVVFVFLIGFAVSYLAQTGRKRWAVALAVGTVALLVALVLAVANAFRLVTG